MMRYFSIFTAILNTAAATTVSYDAGYDDGTRSMNVVACSDGANGLETSECTITSDSKSADTITGYGWTTQGAVADFPYIGGSSDITGW